MVFGGGRNFLRWHWIHESWLPVSRTICWVCGGVPIGRGMIKAIEYLNFDRKLYGGDDDDDDDGDGFWRERREVANLVVGGESGRDLRGRWREKEDEREVWLKRKKMKKKKKTGFEMGNIFVCFFHCEEDGEKKER